MVERISNALNKAKGKVCTTATVLAATAQLTMTNAMAANATSGNGTADNIVLGIAEVVVNIFPLIGIFFVIAGVFKLIMAYRNNQPEDQSTAAKDIVIGAIFIVFRVFAWTPIKGLL